MTNPLSDFEQLLDACSQLGCLGANLDLLSDEVIRVVGSVFDALNEAQFSVQFPEHAEDVDRMLNQAQGRLLALGEFAEQRRASARERCPRYYKPSCETLTPEGVQLTEAQSNLPSQRKEDAA